MTPGPRAWSQLPRCSASRWFLALWSLALGIGALLAVQPTHPLADVTHYKYWTRLVTLEGVAASYSGQYPETYAIYPPVTLYGLALIGHLYQALLDPSFDLDRALASRGLTIAIRGLALGMHQLAGAVLYALLWRWVGPRAALVGAGVYLLNPGALWDQAVWGQPDAWHALFLLLGLWLIGRRRAGQAGAWLGLAAMTKPQAWVLLPLAGVATLRQTGWRGALRAGAVGLAMALLVLLPYLAAGRLREVLTLPGQIASVMPAASANAHNLWWIVTRGAFPFVVDSEPLGGPWPLTYRQAAALLVLAVVSFTLWRAWLASGPWELAELAAYGAHAWFCVTTGAHENHPFMVFPLLCLVWWRSRFLAAVLALLVVTFSFNVLAHDFSLAPLVDAALGPWNLRLQLAASALNLLIAGAWTVRWLWPAREPAARRAPSTRLDTNHPRFLY